MNIWCDRLRGVERPGAHEQAVAGDDVIAAPYRRAAALAKEDVVRMLAAAARQPERSRRDRAGLDKFRLDPDVDHERAAGQTLTIATVTGVHDQGACGQLVADRTARAPTFEVHVCSSIGVSGVTWRALARSTTRHRYQLAGVR